MPSSVEEGRTVASASGDAIDAAAGVAQPAPSSSCWCRRLGRRLAAARTPAPHDPSSHKATEIHVLSFARPHMRAFHCSWVSFFVSFFVWFAIVPLLPYIQDTLELATNQIWISNIFNLIPTERLIVGPLCDRYGPRKVFLAVLCIAAVPTACTGFVNTAEGLYALRFFIGMAGGSFVVCQYWSTIMFAPEIVGQANGLTGGWGNLGGGVTQLVIGTWLMPLFLKHTDAETAWRTISLIPAALAVVTGVVVFFISDDSPSAGKHHRRSTILDRKSLVEHKANANEAFMSAAKRPASWILLIHYLCSFGIELTMLGSIGAYFTDTFEISHHEASAIASIFGWMNLFARGMGGWLSDLASKRLGMKGRLYTQAVCFTVEGVFVLILGSMQTFAGAFTIMIFFSIAVQASEGTTFAIVPSVDLKFPGAVSGIVSSGGNLGGLIFTSLFLVMQYHVIFYVMGVCCLASVPLTIFIKVDEESEDKEGVETERTASIVSAAHTARSREMKFSEDEPSQ